MKTPESMTSVVISCSPNLKRPHLLLVKREEWEKTLLVKGEAKEKK